jgi:hypothetical protein
MPHRITALSAAAALLCSSAAIGSAFATNGFGISLSVPVLCTLHHEPALVPVGNGYDLGELTEFCNAPGGYEVSVNYAPGTMRGAIVSVGGESVRLDGSGRTTVSRAPGPRIRDRMIIAEPGAKGFDTDRLNFDIVAI